MHIGKRRQELGASLRLAVCPARHREHSIPNVPVAQHSTARERQSRMVTGCMRPTTEATWPHENKPTSPSDVGTRRPWYSCQSMSLGREQQRAGDGRRRRGRGRSVATVGLMQSTMDLVGDAERTVREVSAAEA